MPLKGDLKALGGFLRKLQKLPDASQEIARALGPKVSELVGETFARQESPEHEPWTPTKSGAPAFAGSDALGYVLSRLAGKSSVRTTVLYPLHFHQDGTRKIGRKGMRKIVNASIGTSLRQLGFKGIATPRRRKGESDEAYAARLQKVAAAKELRARAVKELKGSAQEKAQAARDAGGWHDPPRPMIPEGDAIPDHWFTVIRETARDVLAKYGAEEKG